jgi:hypothetical protein
MKNAKEIAEAINTHFTSIDHHTHNHTVYLEDMIIEIQMDAEIATLEEAAKIAESWNEGYSKTGPEIAAAIRKKMDSLDGR